MSLCGLLLPLSRAAAASASSAAIGLSARANTGAPAPVADLGASSFLEGQIDVSWTAPDENEFFQTGHPVTSYIVRRATFSVDSLLGDTTSWWNSAQSLLSFGPGQAPGAQETIAVGGLDPGATYYLAVRSLDELNLISKIDARAASTGQQAAVRVFDLAPSSPTGVTAVALSSSIVALTWNAVPAPDLDFYQIAVDSSPPYDFADQYLIAVDSSATSFQHAGLSPSATYSYRIAAVDQGAPFFAGDALQSPFSSVASVSTSLTAPSSPSGLSATAGVLTVRLRWDPLPPSAQGTGLRFYRVWRSLSANSGFVSLATTTASSLADRPLAAGVTYYYAVGAQDISGTDGPLTPAVFAAPFTLLPLEPIGVTVAPATTSVTFSWSPTTRFSDGTPFVSTGTANADELIGYSVQRSTNLCEPYFVGVASLPATATTITDDTGGRNYFYRLFSYNSLGLSSSAVTLSSLGERYYFMDDCATRLVLDDGTANALNGNVNGVGDIRIRSVRRPQDVGNGILQSVEWTPLLDGATEMAGFALPVPARIVLRFDVANGRPVPSTAPVGHLAAAVTPAAPTAIGDLGAYWYNGAEFKKMYGRVDPAAQTVTVESPNLGRYQIRALARAAGAVFDLSNLSSRVITPNGDGLNDVAIFTYDPGPRSAAASGRIFDLQGAGVSSMVPGLVPNTLTWDGRINGVPAASGVYVYRITGDGKTFTGTIVVAR